MDQFTPGDHGSTFGGYTLAAAVVKRALEVMVRDNYVENAREMGRYFQERLKAISSPYIKEVRGLGLLIGVEIADNSSGVTARGLCEK